jgi:hypothetical protein
MNFKERQIDIYNKEVSLSNETNKLLYDLLISLSPIQKKRLGGYDISSNGFDELCISSINVINHSIQLELENDLGDEETKDIESLSQVEQKDLIDYIMLNVLKW